VRWVGSAEQGISVIESLILSFDVRTAHRAGLQTMDESLPERPALCFEVVLPSNSAMVGIGGNVHLGLPP